MREVPTQYGARPLLLLIIFLALLCLYANPLRLFAKALVLKRGRISENTLPLWPPDLPPSKRDALPLSVCGEAPAARRATLVASA